MQTDNNAQIIDFSRFKQERQLVEADANPANFTPTLIWYPVWVLVPNAPQTPTS